MFYVMTVNKWLRAAQTSTASYILLNIGIGVHQVTNVNDADRDRRDAPLTLQEIINSVNSLRQDKSPGVDGITSEFYRAFEEQLTPFLWKVFTESIAPPPYTNTRPNHTYSET